MRRAGPRLPPLRGRRSRFPALALSSPPWSRPRAMDGNVPAGAECPGLTVCVLTALGGALGFPWVRVNVNRLWTFSPWKPNDVGRAEPSIFSPLSHFTHERPGTGEVERFLRVAPGLGSGGGSRCAGRSPRPARPSSSEATAVGHSASVCPVISSRLVTRSRTGLRLEGPFFTGIWSAFCPGQRTSQSPVGPFQCVGATVAKCHQLGGSGNRS